MRSDKVPGAEPTAYTEGRDEDVDAAIAAAGLLLPPEPLWWDVVDLLFGVGATEAAARAQRYAVPLLTDLLASVREPAVQGLVGDARYGAGGETVTQAFIRILTALSGDWPVMFAPTAFDVRRRAAGGGRPRGGGAAGLGRGGPPGGRLLPARPPRADAPLVDRRRRSRRDPGALPRLACREAQGHPRGSEAALLRRVPPHRGRAGRARPGRTRLCARRGSSGCASRSPRSAWRISGGRSPSSPTATGSSAPAARRRKPGRWPPRSR